ncbi:MAG: ACP S-malonyltransferase [Pirellulaceae bacterium]
MLSKIAFVFPGQGAQTVGMAQQLVESLPAAKNLFDRAADVLGYDLAEVCFSGPAEKLDSTVFSQPALYVASLAALEKLRTDSPDTVNQCAGAAGLSLGEYTALAFAGALEFEDGLRLVQQRGEAMQAAADKVPSGMLSVLGMDREKVSELCDQVRGPDEVLQIANLLCPGNIVVSGHSAACERLVPVAESSGAMRTIKLSVAGAFHTSLMESAVTKLESALSSVNVSQPKIPVYSNVDATFHNDPGEIKSLLVRQVCSPVLWEDSMLAMLGDGFDHFYEVGPGRVLRGLMKRISRKIPCDGVDGV